MRTLRIPTVAIFPGLWCSTCCASGLGVTFVLARGGGYVEEPRAKASALGVADNIIFPGRISDEVRDGLFEVANAAIFRSLFESFGIVELEAGLTTRVCHRIVDEACGGDWAYKVLEAAAAT